MPDSIKVPEDIPTLSASLLPCHIQYTGEADTETYFTPSKTTEINENNEKKNIAHFRGLKLVGETTDLKELGYTGFLVNKSEAIERVKQDYEQDFDHESAIKTVFTHTAVAKFNEFTVYGHDAPAEPTNQWKLIGEWQQLSSVIHEEF